MIAGADGVNVLLIQLGGERPMLLLASFHRNKKRMTATPKQLLDVLSSCRDKPRFPSQVEVSEFNLFDPRHQQDKHNLFQELVGKGLLQIVRDERGRRTPLATVARRPGWPKSNACPSIRT